MNWFKYIKLVLVFFFATCVLSLSISAQEYASMYINSISTPSALALTANTWATVGGGTTFTAGYTSTNWSYSTNVLTATSSADGNYTVMFSLSFNGEFAGNYDVGIGVGGANPTTYYTQRAIDNIRKEVGNVSGVIHVTIAEGARTIALKIRSSVDANVETWKAQVTIIEHKEPASNNYAEMNITGGATPTGTQSSAWVKYPVTGGSNFSTGLVSGFTVGTSQLTVSSTGKYLVVLSASATTEFSATGYSFGVSIGASDPTRVVARRYFTTAGQAGVIYACGILDLATGNVITVKTCQVSGAANKILTLNNASLTLVKIDNTTTSTSPYGGMYATGNSTTTNVISTDTWYQVTAGMGAMTVNSFTHSGGTLTPTGLSAGTYLVNYSAGLLAPSGNPIQVYTSIFVNGSEQTDLTTIRNISSATSVGSIGGTGLISLTQDDSDQPIIMQIKNVTTSSTDDVTVKFAGVSLHRILITGDGSLPVELVNFNAEYKNNAVVVSWQTESEIENLGFVIEKKCTVGANHDLPSGWQQITSYQTNKALEGHGSTAEKHDYQYTDNAVQPGVTYEYRLGDVDYNGEVTWHKAVAITVKAGDTQMATTFGLHKAYPNPFNPSVTLSYGLEKAALTTLQVYNMRGQLVETLVNEHQLLGTYDLNWQPVNLSAGVYIIRLQSGNQTNLQKIVFVK